MPTFSFAMLILEIAAGILLAVVALAFWPYLLLLAVLAIAAVLLLLVLVFASRALDANPAIARALGLLTIGAFVTMLVVAIVRDVKPTEDLWRKRRESWRAWRRRPRF